MKYTIRTKKLWHKLLFTFLLMAVCYNTNAMGVKRYNLPDTDIAVGYKTSDSSGYVTISSEDIQQLIISKDPFLANRNISSTQPFLSIGQSSCYLIFQVTDASMNILTVAISLTVSSGNLSINRGAKTVFICKTPIGCSTCVFLKDQMKNIIGCQ